MDLSSKYRVFLWYQRDMARRREAAKAEGSGAKREIFTKFIFKLSVYFLINLTDHQSIELKLRSMI